LAAARFRSAAMCNATDAPILHSLQWCEKKEIRNGGENLLWLRYVRKVLRDAAAMCKATDAPKLHSLRCDWVKERKERVTQGS
jgi:hypothetical protein